MNIICIDSSGKTLNYMEWPAEGEPVHRKTTSRSKLLALLPEVRACLVRESYTKATWFDSGIALTVETWRGCIRN